MAESLGENVRRGIWRKLGEEKMAWRRGRRQPAMKKMHREKYINIIENWKKKVLYAEIISAYVAKSSKESFGI